MKNFFNPMTASSLLLAPLLIIACAQEKPVVSDKIKAPTKIPSSLNFVSQKPGIALSEAQKKVLQDTFSQKNLHILPPGDLLFPDAKATDQEIAAKEEALKLKDETSYKLYKSIKANCEQKRPTKHIDATFPISGETSLDSFQISFPTADVKGFENLQLNDHLTMKFEAGISDKSSNTCPVDFSLGYNVSATVKEIDSKIPANGKATGKGNLVGSFRINNKDFQTLFGSRGLLMNSNLTGLTVQKDTTGNSLVKMVLNGSYLAVQKKAGTETGTTTGTTTVLVDKQIPFNMTMDVLEKRVSKTENGKKIVDIETEAVTRTNITLEEFKVAFEVHEITTKQQYEDNSTSALKTKKEVFINGHQSTDSNLNLLLNSKNLATSSKNNKILNALK